MAKVLTDNIIPLLKEKTASQWDVIVVDSSVYSPDSGPNVLVTSSRGNIYNVELVNGGSGICIHNMPSSTMIAKVYGSVEYVAGHQYSNLSCTLIAPGSYTYARRGLSINQGTLLSQGENINKAADSQSYAKVADIGGTFWADSRQYTYIRNLYNRQVFKFANISFTTAGGDNAFMGEVEGTALTETTLPTLYVSQSSGSSGKVEKFYHVVELYMPQ